MGGAQFCPANSQPRIPNSVSLDACAGTASGESCWVTCMPGYTAQAPRVELVHFLFPQQRKLMGSSAQNSSGVHWCRRRVRFNEVPEKVPKVPEKVWEGSVESQVRFNRVADKVLEGFGARARSGSMYSGEGSGEGLGGFGAEPSQVQGS